MLSLELKELTADTAELAFDYSITGFDTVEIDRILGDDASLDRPDPADAPPWPAAGFDMPVTNAGDLWVCGTSLYCGGALETPPSSFFALLYPPYLLFSQNLNESGSMACDCQNHHAHKFCVGRRCAETSMAAGRASFCQQIGTARTWLRRPKQ